MVNGNYIMAKYGQLKRVGVSRNKSKLTRQLPTTLPPTVREGEELQWKHPAPVPHSNTIGSTQLTF